MTKNQKIEEKIKQLELTLKEAGYKVRYEKGNFNSGFCVINAQNVVVVNKYFMSQDRLNCLADIADQLQISKNK